MSSLASTLPSSVVKSSSSSAIVSSFAFTPSAFDCAKLPISSSSSAILLIFSSWDTNNFLALSISSVFLSIALVLASMASALPEISLSCSAFLSFISSIFSAVLTKPVATVLISPVFLSTLASTFLSVSRPSLVPFTASNAVVRLSKFVIEVS